MTKLTGTGPLDASLVMAKTTPMSVQPLTTSSPIAVADVVVVDPGRPVTVGMSVDDQSLVKSGLKSAAPTPNKMTALADIQAKVASGGMSPCAGRVCMQAQHLREQMKIGFTSGVGTAVFGSVAMVGLNSMAIDRFDKALKAVAEANPASPSQRQELIEAALVLNDRVNLGFMGLAQGTAADFSLSVKNLIVALEAPETAPTRQGALAGGLLAEVNAPLRTQTLKHSYERLENILSIAVALEDVSLSQLLADDSVMGKPDNVKRLTIALAAVGDNFKLQQDAAGRWTISRGGKELDASALKGLAKTIQDTSRGYSSDFRSAMLVHGHLLGGNERSRYDELYAWSVNCAKDRAVKVSSAADLVTKIVFKGATTEAEVDKRTVILEKLRNKQIDYKTASPEEKRIIDELVAAGLATVADDGMAALDVPEDVAKVIDHMITVLKDTSSPERQEMLQAILTMARADAAKSEAEAAVREQAATRTKLTVAADDGVDWTMGRVATAAPPASLGQTAVEEERKQAAQQGSATTAQHTQHNQQVMHLLRQRLDDAKHEAFLQGLKGKH